MKMRVERFLAITAMLASTAALAIGCVTEEDSGGGPGGSGGTGATGGSGGTAGSTAGSAGSTAGSAGSGATGGEAGAAGADGGEQCLGDTAKNADAGAEYDFCGALPYVNDTCADAGSESGLPLGLDLCYHMTDYGKLGVTEEMASCLAAITVADACSTAHDDAVQDCVNAVFPKACPLAPYDDGDGGTIDLCDEVSTACTAVTKAECAAALAPFSSVGAYDLVVCFDAKNSTAATCEADFYDCVLPF
jgi:hypothetical protein